MRPLCHMVHALMVLFLSVKTLEYSVARINRLNEWIGRCVAWLSFTMALVTFVIVALRYGLNLGWIWMQESVVYMHGMLFMLTVGYTLLKQGHVRVDIFYRPADRRYKAAVDLFGALFLLCPTCLVILYYGYPYVADSWVVLEGSKEAGGIPGVFLLKTTILLGALLLGLQGLSQAGSSLLILSGKATGDESFTRNGS